MDSKRRNAVRTTDLENQGFLIFRVGSDSRLADVVFEIASSLGRHHSVTTLMVEADPYSLPVHTEGVYMEQPLRYFVLGCLMPAAAGGETTIIDAREAARIVLEERPELAQTRIEYRSSYGSAHAEHNLVVTRPLRHGPNQVLVFRQDVPANKLLSLSDPWTPSTFYDYVDSVLTRSVLTSHRWEAGDILVVDNAVTLHGRAPFSGRREMLRLRVDDSLCAEA